MYKSLVFVMHFWLCNMSLSSGYALYTYNIIITIITIFNVFPGPASISTKTVNLVEKTQKTMQLNTLNLSDAFIQSDLHSSYTFFISTCVPWESNPQPLRC